jgi:hypothetical protein
MLEGWDNDFWIHHDFLSRNPLTDLLVQIFEGWTSFWQRVPYTASCTATERKIMALVIMAPNCKEANLTT